MPARVIAGIARFDVQAEAADMAPGSDTKRALLELVEFEVGGLYIESLLPLFAMDQRLGPAEPVHQYN